MEPLILTARMQPEAQKYFDELRQQHFPPERNFIPAHLTLFHALPQAEINSIRSQLHHFTGSLNAMEGWTTTLKNLGRGVAFVVDCPRLVSLRAELAQLWHDGLTAQDRQTPQLHITVQNKAAPEAVRALLEAFAGQFIPNS